MVVAVVTMLSVRQRNLTLGGVKQLPLSTAAARRTSNLVVEVVEPRRK